MLYYYNICKNSLLQTLKGTLVSGGDRSGYPFQQLVNLIVDGSAVLIGLTYSLLIYREGRSEEQTLYALISLPCCPGRSARLCALAGRPM